MRDDYRHLIGHSFPGGTTSVPTWMNRLWGDAVAATEDPGDNVHPVLAYYAAVQGSGTTFDEMFTLMEHQEDAAVMLGEQKFEFAAPLQVDHQYTVEGGVIDVVRKTGRRSGAFDIMTFELRVSEPGAAEPLAVSTTSFVFQRPSGEP